MELKVTALCKASLIALPLAFGAVSFTGESARAIVIGGNGGPDYLNALTSNLSQGVLFDNFQVSLPTVTDLHWWGSDIDVSVLTVEIYGDMNGVPSFAASVPISLIGTISKTPDGSIGGGALPIFNYSVNIAPINLNTNSTYWLTVYTGQEEWLWATHDQVSGAHLRLAQDAMGNFGFQPEAGNMAFEVTGVPEPLTLGGVALAGLFGAAFKRKLNKSDQENGDKS